MVGEAAIAPQTDRSGLIARVIGSATDLLRSTASYFADLVSDFVSKLALLSPIVVALGSSGCEGNSDAKTAAPVAAKVVEAVSPAVEVEPEKDTRPIGEFDITFYYVTSEEEIAAKIAKQQAEAVAANDNAVAEAGSSSEDGELASVVPAELPPREIVPLYETKTCDVLAEVDKEFAKSLTLQGTGKLRDGRLLNVAGQNNCPCDRKPCFHVIEGQVWGKAGTGKPLAPFRTVAVDPKVIKLGSLLYIPLLEGRTMPGRAPWGGFVHDGCVTADDTGGGIKGFQIDLFVGRKSNFLGLSGSGGSHAWARHVQVFDGASRCERKGRKIGRKAAAI